MGHQFQEHMRLEMRKELIRSPTLDQFDYQKVQAFYVRLGTNLEQERRQLQLQAPRQNLEGAGYKITVYSDHNNLQTFNTTANVSRRQTGWYSKISHFDLVIKHVAGKKNPADLPSSREDYKPSPNNPFPEVHPFFRLAAMAQASSDLFNAFASAAEIDDFAKTID